MRVTGPRFTMWHHRPETFKLATALLVASFVCQNSSIGNSKVSNEVVKGDAVYPVKNVEDIEKNYIKEHIKL